MPLFQRHLNRHANLLPLTACFPLPTQRLPPLETLHELAELRRPTVAKHQCLHRFLPCERPGLHLNNALHRYRWLRFQWRRPP